MYIASNGKRYEQIFVLISDGRKLRELLKKISAHVDLHIERTRLMEIHEDRNMIMKTTNKSLQKSGQEKKDAVMSKRIKMNEKYTHSNTQIDRNTYG